MHATGCRSTIARFNCRVTVSCRAKVSATLQRSETRAWPCDRVWLGWKEEWRALHTHPWRYCNSFIRLFVHLRTSDIEKHLALAKIPKSGLQSQKATSWPAPQDRSGTLNNEWMPLHRKLQYIKIGLIKIMKMSYMILARQTNHSPGFDRSG